MKSADYKRTIRPKNRSDFIRGHICRWEPIGVTSRSLNSDANQDNTFIQLQNMGKENVLDSKPLKVYYRSKAKMKSINVGIMDRKGVLLEGEKEDLGSENDEDIPLIHKPELSSDSSFSESEDKFRSESATEKDKDEELEGISSLFGIPEHLGEINQDLTVQGGEIQKEGSQPLNVDSKIGVEEWKQVQDILTHLGLRLIPKNEKTHCQGSCNGMGKRKGIRELQNLKFNVNYNRWGCSRGTQSSP